LASKEAFEIMHRLLSTALSRCNAAWILLSLGAVACGAGAHPAAAPPCDQACQDGVALRGVRTLLKLAYNQTVQAKPVGAQDARSDCLPLDGELGSVHVFGTATSVAEQGASFVTLSYDFEHCSYSAPPDPTAEQNYSVTLSGLVTEQGTISAQPTSTTALQIQSASLSVVGTVYDPPLDYRATACELAVAQDGSAVAGTWCGRAAGFTF
jgi:hypothetical protein